MGCNESKPEDGGWLSVPLPGIDKSFGTYIWRSPDKIPPININPNFADILTVEDVEKHRCGKLKHLQRSSITDCWFIKRSSQDNDDSYDGPECYDQDLIEKNIFYIDQQYCALWQLDEEEKVREYKSGVIVAPSLPIFLTHLDLDIKAYHMLGEMEDYDDTDRITDPVLKEYILWLIEHREPESEGDASDSD